MDERAETVIVEQMARDVRRRVDRGLFESRLEEALVDGDVVKESKEADIKDIDRVRTGRHEFVEELKAPPGTHFHVLVITFHKDILTEQPRYSDNKMTFVLNPGINGKYTEHSLVGTDIKEIVALARRLGGPLQTEWSIFRVRQVEDGFCARPDLVAVNKPDSE